jgi:2-oxoisovalerate dehydrogenase E1 component
MYCDFMGRAGDEVFNQLCKWQAMSAGYCRMPVVLRVSVGSKYGAQHSQDWTALCAHVPGLKVVFPATPYDAKGLMNAALRGTDPVVFFESQRTYDQTEIFHPQGVPAEYYTVPIGVPAVIKEGQDLTIMTYGATLYRAWQAVQRFEKEFGLSVELIDGRSLVPFDYEILYNSVKKTGKLILSSDACDRGSYLHTVASQITQIAFDYLDAPVCVVGAKDWIVPPAELEDDYYPQPEWLIDAYHQQIKPLPGYRPKIDRSTEEMLKLSKYGVL